MAEARRRGVAGPPGPAFVRRRLGGGVAVLRLRSDGSAGCSAPCLLCARELARFGLKVCCRTDSGAVWRGHVDDPGAPPPKVTSGQRTWLAHWTTCRAAQAGRRGEMPAAVPTSDDDERSDGPIAGSGGDGRRARADRDHSATAFRNGSNSERGSGSGSDSDSSNRSGGGSRRRRRGGR